MRTNKDGSPDKRFSKKDPSKAVFKTKFNHGGKKAILIQSPKMDELRDRIYDSTARQDPNVLHDELLKENNLQLDFDVLSGTVATKYGIIKLEKPILVIRASYVKR